MFIYFLFHLVKTTWIGLFGGLTIDKSYRIAGSSPVPSQSINKMKIHLKNSKNAFFGFRSLSFVLRVFHLPKRKNQTKYECSDNISNIFVFVFTIKKKKHFHWRFRHFASLYWFLHSVHGEQWHSFGRHCVVVGIKQIETERKIECTLQERVKSHKWIRTNESRGNGGNGIGEQKKSISAFNL